MTPEQWQRIEALYHAALERPVDERFRRFYMIAFRPGIGSRSGPVGEGYDFVHAVQPATINDSLIWGAARFAPSAS